MSPLRLIVAVFLGIAAAGAAVADTSVWIISDGHSEVILGGTVHLLRSSDFPLPQEFELAYERAERVVFETDMDALSTPELQARMVQKLTYPEGTSLRTVLNDEAYAALREHLAADGIPLEAIEQFKPGLIASTLEALELQRLGFQPTGVDTYFNQRAVEDGRPRGALESVDVQIAFLENMGRGMESEFILMELEDMEQLGTEIDELVSAWRVGDGQAIYEIAVAEMITETPGLYASLLLDRNMSWLPQIEAMLQDDGTELVLVGAAHLVGVDGLLSMLAERGYTVTHW